MNYATTSAIPANTFFGVYTIEDYIKDHLFYKTENGKVLICEQNGLPCDHVEEFTTDYLDTIYWRYSFTTRLYRESHPHVEKYKQQLKKKEKQEEPQTLSGMVRKNGDTISRVLEILQQNDDNEKKDLKKKIDDLEYRLSVIRDIFEECRPEHDIYLYGKETSTLYQILAQINKIKAIKLRRCIEQEGLKDAKEYIDKIK